MTVEAIQAIFRALNEAEVRYLVCGGLAVVAHGYERLTRDLDLLLALDEGNLQAVIEALTQLEYQPAIPVAFEDLLDPAKRHEWERDKHLIALPCRSEQFPRTPIDLLLTTPFPFGEAHADALPLPFGDGLAVPVLDLQRLIAMKDAAGRSIDRADVEQLRRLRDLDEA
jgi:hypothetical protein